MTADLATDRRPTAAGQQVRALRHFFGGLAAVGGQRGRLRLLLGLQRRQSRAGAAAERGQTRAGAAAERGQPRAGAAQVAARAVRRRSAACPLPLRFAVLAKR